MNVKQCLNDSFSLRIQLNYPLHCAIDLYALRFIRQFLFSFNLATCALFFSSLNYNILSCTSKNCLFSYSFSIVVQYLSDSTVLQSTVLYGTMFSLSQCFCTGTAHVRENTVLYRTLLISGILYLYRFC